MSGSAHIRGYVATGPGGIISVGGSAFVGDQTYSGSGIQPGHLTNNFTMAFPPVLAPFTNTTSGVQTPTNGAIAGTNYTYVLNGGNYFTTNLASLAYGKTLYVVSNSTLFVTGNVDLSTVIFDKANKPRLDLYVSAPSLSFTPTILGTPPQFWIYGLPSCTSMNLGAGTSFQGVIYAPQVSLRGHGNSSFCGAIVAASFTCFGTFDFHYDTSSRAVQAKEFKILSWVEL
jgi:hypothetical protein